MKFSINFTSQGRPFASVRIKMNYPYVRSVREVTTTRCRNRTVISLKSQSGGDNDGWSLKTKEEMPRTNRLRRHVY